MVNHICEPISSNQFASCSSARVGQGGGGAPLTLNRQSERYRREGIDLSVSTLADQVGACTTVLQPLHALIERHVLTAERLHGDDTTVPILAKGKTVTGHIWTYVRDDRPFDGRAPPAALY